MKHAIGIDPGFGETGVVLSVEVKDDLIPIAWATFSSPTGYEPVCRAVSIANEIVSQIIQWVEKHKIERLDIGIETPVYKRNAATFTMQVRLLQEVESGLFHLVAGMVRECWLTEVNPMTSKVLATGSGRADKAAMVAASPFAESGLPDHTLEAIADAWAHSLATWTNSSDHRMRFSSLRAAPVNFVATWEADDAVHPSSS